MRLKIILLLISITTFNQSMAATSVGTAPLGTPPGTGVCNFASIQEALDSGATNINVLNDEVFEENILIDHAVEITGGFATCQDANFGLIPTETNTKIKGTDILGESVVRIETDDNPTIKLINLTLQSANHDISIPNGGHGIKIDESNGEIWLINSSIGLNNSEYGAGIYMVNFGFTSSDDLSVILENTNVTFNTAESNGGGVYCYGDGANLFVSENSFIGANVAANGGGVYAFDCHLTMSSGVDVHTSSDLSGLMYNNASNDGGGIYAFSSDIILNAASYGYSYLHYTRDSDTPVTVAKNIAGNNGGGIFIDDGTLLTIKDALIEGNTAGNYGGGIYESSTIQSNASFVHLLLSNRACWNEGACLEISNNKAHTGGAFYLNGPTTFKATNTTFSGNRANFGTVGYADGEESVISIEGSYLFNNGNNGVGNYTDNTVLHLLYNSTLILRNTTIADNDIDDSSAIITSSHSTLTFDASIIHNNETVLAELDTVSSNFSCLVVNENNSISGERIYVVVDPGFVDAENQNYHLRPFYVAVDLCEPNSNTPDYDSDGDPRVWDEPTLINTEASLDAGADEYFIDLIFNNDFED